MEFRLTIRLGNAEMQTNEDVADALKQVADHVAQGYRRDSHILDVNGNTVGNWQFIEEDA